MGSILRGEPGGDGRGSGDRLRKEESEPRSLLRGKLWFWAPIPPLVILDLWSKAAAFAYLADLPAWQVRHGHEVFRWGWLNLHLVAWRNRGTVWGLFQEFQAVLMVLRTVAVVVILYFVWKTPRWAPFRQLVLGLIMAGALGNLYDNFTEKDGGVRDFLYFSGRLLGWEWDFPAFNVADACITVGALSLALLLWRADTAKQRVGTAGGVE